MAYTVEMKLHENQLKILRVLKRNPNASLREIQADCGMSCHSLVEDHMKKLVKLGYIKRGVKWVVLKETN